jgi:hypothetical protein
MSQNALASTLSSPWASNKSEPWTPSPLASLALLSGARDSICMFLCHSLCSSPPPLSLLDFGPDCLTRPLCHVLQRCNGLVQHLHHLCVGSVSVKRNGVQLPWYFAFLRAACCPDCVHTPHTHLLSMCFSLHIHPHRRHRTI